MKSISQNETRLSRQLKTSDAVIVGLGSMIGAGIFASIGPAAAAAGGGFILAVVIAGGLAYLNATSMAQLAAVYPESGGAYVYGKRRLGEVWGFLAGWGFVIGKIASCTAMALTFAHYIFPEQARLWAISAVLVLTLINLRGIRKTAFLTKIILSIVLIALMFVVFESWSNEEARLSKVFVWNETWGIKSLLEACGLMFFSFAGYARIATLGEEVIDPKTTIPRAIRLALFITLIVYLIVVVSALAAVDAKVLATSSAPLSAVVKSGKHANFSFIVQVGACFASLGVLLSLLLGISRTIFAMAAQSDLPRWLSQVHPIYKVPHRAEMILGLTVVGIIMLSDLGSAIGFSSFAILIYYAIANAAAWTLPAGQRLWPRWMSLLGGVVCVGVAFSLPTTSVFQGISLYGIGLGIFFFKSKLLQRRHSK